ncbi:MAG: phosphoribosylanthranilate isomerase [Desulfuromonas sp.]|nr:MAG: phosphoribosylanthranilate isomerase [Desulfuromonas sp.]
MFRIKICGITNESDALHAVACGADALGFVFYADSPRGVSPAEVRPIIDKLPGEVIKVGLFVNEQAEVVNRVAAESGIGLVQLHGDETPDYCRRIELPVMKALRVRNEESVRSWQDYPAVAILLDAWHPEKFGGTGEACDWNLAATLATQTKIILAGGLNPQNISKAVRMVRPQGVDVSSGVEKMPGKKDPEKVAAFITNARESFK